MVEVLFLLIVGTSDGEIRAGTFDTAEACRITLAEVSVHPAAVTVSKDCVKVEMKKARDEKAR